MNTSLRSSISIANLMPPSGAVICTADQAAEAYVDKVERGRVLKGERGRQILEKVKECCGTAASILFRISKQTGGAAVEPEPT